MSTEATHTPKKRDRIGVILYLLYVALLIASVILIVRLTGIQLFFQPDPKIEAALTPSNTVSIIEPARGNILDAEGRLLAISCPIYQFYMDCTVLKETNNAQQEQAWLDKARELSAGLAAEFPEKSADQFYKLIKDSRAAGKKYVRIGRPVDRNAYNRIIELPLFRDGRYRSGMIVEQEQIRQYPYGKLARRTIGFVRNNKSTVTNTHIGLEGKFDYILHGQEGREWMRVTDYGRVRNTDSAFVKAVDGKDLRITLNIDYQDIADKALREQIVEEPDLEGATLVLMEVKTGAIRAMVNLVREDGTGPFEEIQNLAIGRKGEPGSVFKTVTLMSVLNDGFIKSLDETLPATTGHVAGTSINDDHIPSYAWQHKTNRISILDGFKISSNYVFATLAVQNYGIDKSKGRGKGLEKTERFLQNIYNYKLGEAFAFDLDGLQTPTIPSPSTRYWTDTDLGSIGFGYSTEETPLHILTFYNAIANKGRMMKPYLVEDIEEKGIVTERRGPGVLNAAVCSKAVADTITRALKAVTEEGTAKRLKGAKCAVAGKTGTSFGTYANGQYQDAQGRRKYQGTFVGFFPADAPQYSIICTVYSKPTGKQFQGGGIPARAIRTVVDQLYNIDPAFREQLKRNPAQAQ
ncbi:MAG: penicillin-binding protein 2 [Bacteroidales bacterium]|nr:penicillin-binding protein 2 [Bacteroidales bacterium]